MNRYADNYYEKAVADIERMMQCLQEEKQREIKEKESKNLYAEHITLLEASKIRQTVCNKTSHICDNCIFKPFGSCSEFILNSPIEAEKILLYAKAKYSI